jgi:hypothetical protein
LTSSDLVSFGEEQMNAEKLQAFLEAVNNNNNRFSLSLSRLFYIPYPCTSFFNNASNFCIQVSVFNRSALYF